MPALKNQIKDPATGKRLTRVFVTGKGWFTWNTAYHVYNAVTNYEQLQMADVAHVDFAKAD